MSIEIAIEAETGNLRRSIQSIHHLHPEAHRFHILSGTRYRFAGKSEHPASDNDNELAYVGSRTTRRDSGEGEYYLGELQFTFLIKERYKAAREIFSMMYSAPISFNRRPTGRSVECS